jgi:hypothetical protein
VTVSFIGGGTWSTLRKPAASHWQTLSHTVLSCTPFPSGIRTHNVSGDRQRLHMEFLIQLPYNHGYDGPCWNSIVSRHDKYAKKWKSKNTTLSQFRNIIRIS